MMCRRLSPPPGTSSRDWRRTPRPVSSRAAALKTAVERVVQLRNDGREVASLEREVGRLPRALERAGDAEFDRVAGDRAPELASLFLAPLVSGPATATSPFTTGRALKTLPPWRARITAPSTCSRDDLGHRGAAEQPQTELHLLAQQPKHVATPSSPHGERVDGRASDEHARAPRARAEGRRPRGDAAVEQHLGTPVERLGDPLQRLDRCGDAVELAPAVVRDDDAGSAVLDPETRVFRRQHPLQYDRKPVPGDPFDVAPADARVDVVEDVAGDLELVRDVEAVAQRALAATEDRDVDGSTSAE